MDIPFLCRNKASDNRQVMLYFAKHICFGLQKISFCTPKDGLLHPESLAFAGERYMFRKRVGLMLTGRCWKSAENQRFAKMLVFDDFRRKMRSGYENNGKTAFSVVLFFRCDVVLRVVGGGAGGCFQEKEESRGYLSLL